MIVQDMVTNVANNENDTVPEAAALEAPKGTQAVLRGSVSEEDLRKVFSDFVEWVCWDDPTKIPVARRKIEKRRTRLTDRLAKLMERVHKIQGKLALVDAELRSPEEKKEEASQYLVAAVEQMGAFASMEVLSAALKKKYPRVIVHRRSEAAAAPAAPPAPTPPANEGRVQTQHKFNGETTKVYESLDHEGMSLTEIVQAASLDKKVVRLALAELRQAGLVGTTGVRSTMRYSLKQSTEE